MAGPERTSRSRSQRETREAGEKGGRNFFPRKAFYFAAAEASRSGDPDINPQDVSGRSPTSVAHGSPSLADRAPRGKPHALLWRPPKKVDDGETRLIVRGVSFRQFDGDITWSTRAPSLAANPALHSSPLFSRTTVLLEPRVIISRRLEAPAASPSADDARPFASPTVHFPLLLSRLGAFPGPGIMTCCFLRA